jgi:predicted transcriptional regulator YdeE
MKEANQLFLERRNEIKGIINEQEYVCPHFANDILFTYIYCMEVEGINDTPNGMIGFYVPGQRYIKVRSTDQDPYAISHEYLKENDLENNTRSLALEVFKFGEEQHFNNADIYIPIVERKYVSFSGRQLLQLTPYSRFGPFGPRSARCISGK